MDYRATATAEDVIVEYATAEQRALRLADIRNWLAYFQEECLKELGRQVSFIDDAAVLINHYYWETLEARVRSRIASKDGGAVTVDRHKICSLTELVIMHVLPVKQGDEGKRIALSARLAYYCAMNILGCWDARTVDGLHVSTSFEREHLTWLRNVNQCGEGFPVFSNAATWYLVELIALERAAR